MLYGVLIRSQHEFRSEIDAFNEEWRAQSIIDKRYHKYISLIKN
jgi:hypothetical protein